jgi:hypothetical protein
MAKWQPNYHDLSPDHRYLSDIAVLVQAWKKTHAYIRMHNWYADSLELDLSSIRLHDTLKDWSHLLLPGTYQRFVPSPARLVPAPKSHSWDVEKGWMPDDGEEALTLRPLAHLSIRDQTLATSFLICLANIVEKAQGNPDVPIVDAHAHKTVSYGHRLVSSWDGERATFRWGNAKLYRQYYTDYQVFVQRSEVIKDKVFTSGNGWAIVQADLRKFYDNISRETLIEKLQLLAERESNTTLDRHFFAAMRHVFAWKWHSDDVDLVAIYTGKEITDGLPQGLAASGFFANAYLIDFDRRIAAGFGQHANNYSWQIVDYCRYVDDMRFVLRVPDALPATQIKQEIEAYLENTLAQAAPGLAINPDKTQVVLGDSQSSHTPIADAMQTISTRVSGPLDVTTAKQALELLDGLLALSGQRRKGLVPKDTGQDEALARLFATEPDVRNETVERFVAHRWRRVFRSLRVMSDAEGLSDSSLNVGREFLDQRAEGFATELIRRWIEDPSNVRLLRVAMDVCPSSQHLEIVLGLLDAHLSQPSQTKTRTICAYVAAELLRAGATETGFVRDADELPGSADVADYRQRLLEFAIKRLTAEPSEPWYLVQQAMLFLAVMGEPLPAGTPIYDINQSYLALHQLLKSEWPQGPQGYEFGLHETIPLLLSAHRISGDTESFAGLLAGLMTEIRSSDIRELLMTILIEDDTLVDAIWHQLDSAEATFWHDHFAAIGYLTDEESVGKWNPAQPSDVFVPLLTVISSPDNPFRQETAALRLLLGVLNEWGKPVQRKQLGEGCLAPARVEVKCSSWERLKDPAGILRPDEFQIQIRQQGIQPDPRYEPPEWCKQNDRWRIEVAQVLRASIIGKGDFSVSYHVTHAVEGIRRYQGNRTNWFKRKHGLFSGRGGLGDRFLPVSPWMSELLWKLLAWPGMELPDELVDLPAKCSPKRLEAIAKDRLRHLGEQYCRSVGMPCYEYPVKVSARPGDDSQFRVAVVQSVLPHKCHFEQFGLQLNDPAFRRKHRRHVNSMLHLVLRLLDVREGYKDTREHVDLVVFPELAIHTDDLGHIIRFADTAKCMVFCGMVFHPHPDCGQNLVNSGMWVLPVETTEGRMIDLIEQGKFNMTPDEKKMGVVSYRPCQWIIEGQKHNQPWRLTRAICYDATDLRLAADMRDLSDAFVVPALNQDTGTFDAMVGALHYHMYQHVILVNTGEFGGTTVQAPYKAPYERLIVHHHGMDEALVSVFALNLTDFRTVSTVTASLRSRKERKHPPAGHRR